MATPGLPIIASEPPGAWMRDRFLLASLLLALGFCVHGMHWGVVETWHADQLVYRELLDPDKLPLEPPDFLKPPFHTYLSFFLVRAPVFVIADVLGVSDHARRIVELIGARLLTAVLFLGQVVLVYVVSRRFFGRTAARVTSLLLATSAGFVAHSHFLTVDVPASFWMLLAFLFAQNILLHGRTRDYILAGFFTGVATATKYNALAVGISIPVAHWLLSEDPFLTTDWSLWRRRLFDPRLVAGVGVVAVGFVMANPYAIISYSEFIRDFLYNIVWTQYHEGAETQSGYGYGLFFERLGELFGYPAAVLIAIGCVFAVWRLFVSRPQRVEVDGVVMLSAVFLLYYAYFGSFGRLPMRFVLPVAPYWLMLVGPLVATLRPRHLALPVAVVVAYNILCSVYMGWRFTNDPRMLARTWISDHIAQGSSIEYTSYTPRPERFAEKQFQAEKMPRITGRLKLFKDILAQNALVQENLSRFEGEDEPIEWYTIEALEARAPDYVWIVSDYYERFFSDELVEYYPGVRQYFRGLLDEPANYAITYDAATPALPWWVYPQYVYGLGNRITILERQSPRP